MTMKKVGRLYLQSLMLLLVAVSLWMLATHVAFADSRPVRATDVTSPSSGNCLVLVDGEFIYLEKAKILKRINEIRYEACSEGAPYPGNRSRKLQLSDYKPLTWSSNLEWIAQTRAAEASIHMDHERPNGTSWSSLKKNGERSNAENIAWNWSASILGGINQWYDEKSYWVNNTPGEVTGHYTSIINPGYSCIGIGAFMPDADEIGAVVGELGTYASSNESQNGARGTYSQVVEVYKSSLTENPTTPVTIHIGKDKEMNLNPTTSYNNDLGPWWSPEVSKVRYKDITWTSDNPSIATIPSTGSKAGFAKALSPGRTKIRSNANGKTNIIDIIVEDHKRVDIPGVAATCTKSGWTVGKKCSICSEVLVPRSVIPALGHSPQKINGKAATCTAKGNKEYYRCTRCKLQFSDSNCTHTTTADKVAIPAKGHKYGAWTKLNATQHQKVCANDKRHVEIANHTWDGGKVTKDATELATGIKTYTCRACKATKTESIPMKPVSKPIGQPIIRNTIANSAKKTNDVIWDKSKVKGATNYEIQWRAKGASNWASTRVGNTVRGVTTGLSIGQLYEIRVRPLNVVGSKTAYGDWSPTIYRYFHTTQKIRLTSASKGTFTMSWQKNPAATSYQVMYTTNSNGAGAANNINTVGANATSFTKAGLKSGVTYYVQVREIRKVNGINYIGNISCPVAVKVR